MKMFYFRELQNSLAILALLGALFYGPTSSFASERCLRDERRIQVDQSNVIRFRDYLCQTNEGAVRVQFHRLNDFAASALIHDSLPPRLKKLLGNTRIYKNDVYQEFRGILKKFGDNLGYEPFLSITSPTGDGLNRAQVVGAATNSKLSDVPLLFDIQDDGKVIDFPQPDAIYSLINNQKLPNKFKRVPGRIIWKYMTRKEVHSFSSLVSRLNRLVDKNIIEDDYGGRTPEVTRTLKLIKYLTKDNWPEDFVVIVGQSGKEVYGCIDTPWEFYYYQRLPILDIALIENKSDKAVNIEALFGSRSSTHSLRPQSATHKLRKARSSQVARDIGKLNPGEKMVVPIRITFASNKALQDLFKRKSSNNPRLRNYVFGPEIALAGMQISGRAFDFEGGSANYLALTTSCECGSCPYLYSWDQTAERWLSHGKVIHTAKGKDKETIETRVLKGLVTKFRLAEEEAELAFINKVELTLNLKGGSKVLLKPEIKSLRSADDSYNKIYFGHSTEINFEVPDWIKLSNVESSEFSVTGYYIRYGGLLKFSSKISDISSISYSPRTP